MGRAGSRYGERIGAYRVLVRNLREGDHVEESCVDGRIMLKWIFEKWDGGMDGIDLARDRER